MNTERIEHEQAEKLAVRLVPVSATQIEVLESVGRAFAGLTADFWREYGVEHDDRIAGGLYRICSTLEMIVALWRETSDDAATVESWRRALERIARGDLSVERARRMAARALEADLAPK